MAAERERRERANGEVGDDGNDSWGGLSPSPARRGDQASTQLRAAVGESGDHLLFAD